MTKINAIVMRRYLFRFCISNNWKNIFIYLFGLVIFFAFIVILDNYATSVELVEKENLSYSSEINLSDYHPKEEIKNFTEVRESTLDNHFEKFANEDVRVVGFTNPLQKSSTVNKSSTKVIYLATRYFTEWNSWSYYSLHDGDTTFRRYPCPNPNCRATKDAKEIEKADAVLFHIRDLDINSPPDIRFPHQVWILYSMEPPWLEIRDMRRFDGAFNWTMSYRRSSDLLLKYGFVGKKSHQKLNKEIETEVKNQNIFTLLFNKISRLFQDFPRKEVIVKKNRAVWLVSNCRTDSNREEYVARLRKVFPVDVFGGCGEEACTPAEAAKCYSQMARGYKFYLAFENAICRDYVTEKLFNVLEFEMIPVVLGGADYHELVPEHSVINAMDFGSPEDLGMYLVEVSRDDWLYKSYFWWKDTYRSYLQPWMCDLCEKLHEPFATTVKSGDFLDEWWNEGGSCQRWYEDGFQTADKRLFPAYHTKLFET